MTYAAEQHSTVVTVVSFNSPFHSWKQTIVNMQEVQVGQVYSPNKSTELEGGSPSLNKSANSFEAFTTQAFSEHVGPLFLSINLDDCDGAVANVRPKEMPFDLEVLRPIGDSLVGGLKKCTVVVFEHTTPNG